MAQKVKGVIMGRVSCEWVRQWLPLLEEDGDGLSSEPGDVSPEDRRQIECHVMDCQSCQAHRASLGCALSVLRLVASASAINRDLPSILPAVNDRIQRQSKQSRSIWLWIRRKSCFWAIGSPEDRRRRGFGRLRADLPLRIAFLPDSLTEWLTSRPRLVAWNLGANPHTLPWPGVFGRRVAVTGGLVMVGLLVFLVGSSLVRGEHEARVQIAVNTAPIPDLDVTQAETMVEASDPAPETSPSSESATDSYSPLAEVSVSPEPLVMISQTSPAKPVGATSSSVPSSTVPAPRYDFDLEHGTPMPPDSRAGKPAY
jgi:hypothetical protein